MLARQTLSNATLCFAQDGIVGLPTGLVFALS